MMCDSNKEDFSDNWGKLNEQCEFSNVVPRDVVVSIVMITYNHASYIAQAIESVLMQKATFPIELCIGEDDSTDGTREICIKYAKKFPDRIRLFLRDGKDKIYNGGRPTGKKNGILTRMACRGEYIAICEGDDFWIDSAKLQKQFNFMESNPEVGISCTAAIMRSDCGAADKVFPVYYPGGIPHYSFFFMDTFMATATLFFRRSVGTHGFSMSPRVFMGDWALLVSLTEGGRVCAMLPDITAVYRKHDAGFWSGSSVTSRQRHAIYVSAAEEYLRFAPKDSKPWIKRTLHYLSCRETLRDSSVRPLWQPWSTFSLLGGRAGIVFYYEYIRERICLRLSFPKSRKSSPLFSFICKWL